MSLSNIWIVIAPVLGAVLGFLIRESMAISTRRNGLPPSLTYYWSLAKNRWTVVINGLITAAAMMGRAEMVTITSSAPFADRWPEVYAFTQFLQVAPFWSSLGIGLFSAFLVRWFISMVDQRMGRSAKARDKSAHE